MEREEIFRYITVGRPRAITVDCRELKQYPGIIRTLVIQGNAQIQLNFLDEWNIKFDEGEVTFYFCYEDYEKLFEAVEEYLGMKMEDWTNYNRTGWYPDISGIKTKESWDNLASDFTNGKLEFPERYQTFRIADSYWKALYHGLIKPEDPFEVFLRWEAKQRRMKEEKEAKERKRKRKNKKKKKRKLKNKYKR